MSLRLEDAHVAAHMTGLTAPLLTLVKKLDVVTRGRFITRVTLVPSFVKATAAKVCSIILFLNSVFFLNIHTCEYFDIRVKFF